MENFEVIIDIESKHFNVRAKNERAAEKLALELFNIEDEVIIKMSLYKKIYNKNSKEKTGYVN